MPQRGGSRVPYGAAWKPEEPKVNWLPFILVFVGFVVFLVVAMQATWVGQLMRRGDQPEDPIAKMTYSDARNTIDAQLNQGLTAAGATHTKMIWKAANSGDSGAAQPSPADEANARAADAPIELTIDTTLPTPDARKQIIDPIKPYMEKAKLYTINMSDSKSHAHWTYNMTPGAPAPDPSAE